MNARDRMIKALEFAEAKAALDGIDKPYVEIYADAALAALPDLLTDPDTIEATARMLYGGFEASEGTKGEVRVTLTAAAKALTAEDES